MAKKVFLSAGHGGTDPGAVGNGLYEKNINLQILLECREQLERHGVAVTCSRLKDENDPVSEEVKEANASNADVAVSFHTNAGGGDGSETYYWETSANGKKLAELCEKHTKAIGQNSRGVKTANLMFTRETKMVAVLCECAFIDNKTDIAIVDTLAEQQKFGKAYAKAILEYLGITYKEEIAASPSGKLYKVQVGAYSVKANADNMAKRLKEDGYSTYIVKVGNLYKVQTGAFSVKANADALAAELKADGYSTYITQE